jgi:hypothetical protein
MEDQRAFALAEVGEKGARDDARWRKPFAHGTSSSQPLGNYTAWAFDAEEGKAYRLCEARAADSTQP